MGSAFQALVGLFGLGCSLILTLGLMSEPSAQVDDRATIGLQLVPPPSDASPEAADGAGTEPNSDRPDWAGQPEVSTPAPIPAPRLAPANPGRKLSRPKMIQRTLRVTAYCDQGITAAGVSVGVGQCAAPADIPFGSKIYVPALGRTFVVTDRTHRRFRHNTVDIFMPGEQRCLNFGRKFLDCVITYPEQPWKRPGQS